MSALIKPVILCGGGGTRLWPRSRPARPKPFLPLLGERTLFQQALDRVADPDQFAPAMVVAGEPHVPLVREQGGSELAIIAEPMGRNTAPAIALAALRAPEGSVLLICPSDHYIADAPAFREAARAAAQLAQQGSLVAFGIAWWWFWWRNARRTGRSPERDGYVLVVGVLGGLAATVVAAAGSLHTVLSWVILESAREGSAVEHFDVLSIFATLLVIGLALWAYHRTEVPHAVARQAGGRDEVARLYDHLEAGVGLVASTVGLAVLIGIVLHKVMPAPDDWDRGVGELLVLALTMLAVGVPIWNRAWHRIQAHAGSVPEESSAVRRVYLFAVFGVTGLVVLGSILAMVYMVLFGLLDGSLDVESVATFRIPLALIGATAGISVYHGRVLRSGLTSVPASSRPSLRTVTVVGPAASALLSAIGEVPGVRVVHHLRLDVAEPVEADPADVLDVVRAGTDDMVVVVAGDGSVQVIPVAG